MAARWGLLNVKRLKRKSKGGCGYGGVFWGKKCGTHPDALCLYCVSAAGICLCDLFSSGGAVFLSCLGFGLFSLSAPRRSANVGSCGGTLANIVNVVYCSAGSSVIIATWCWAVLIKGLQKSCVQ